MKNTTSTAAALKLTRLAPGQYLVNDRYEINRTREGTIFQNDTVWFWRDRLEPSRRSGYLDSLAAAKADLQKVLERFDADTLREAHDRVICRLDEKNETVEDAAEAVYPDYGGLAFRARLIAYVNGDRS
jgi:hypothetical protein